jgi:alkaline phosphatase
MNLNRLTLFMAFLLTLMIAGCSIHHGSAVKISNDTEIKYKNVIVMVPDGCSMSIQTLARFYRGADNNVDKLFTGSVRTYSANSVITDSAAAATAFATGHKTTSSFIGVAPRTEDLLPGFTPEVPPYYPLPTILEGAKYNGRSTGIVVTSIIPHATPGGFSAHSSSRFMPDDIMEQIVYQDLDVAFGGGMVHLLPEGQSFKTTDGKTWAGVRKDSENLMDTLKERGYSIISSRDELMQVKGEKVWGLFNNIDLVPDIDRDELNPTQPSLSEMTQKAIEILSKNKNGFFMLVEGSQVDYAGHAHDPAFMVTEFLAFDKAVGVAVDYAKKNKDTIVVVFPDHDTGGLSIGNNSEMGRKYSAISVDTLITPLKNASITIQGLLELAYKDNSATVPEIQELFKTKWNLTLNETQAGEIVKLNKLGYAVADYITNNFTVLGWTTAGHSGVDVPMWVYTPAGDSTLKGNINNTQIARELAKIMDVDLNLMRDELFVDASGMFPDSKITEDKSGYILETNGYAIPANKDIIKIGDKTISTKGISVYINDIKKYFIPKEMVRIIQGTKLK